MRLWHSIKQLWHSIKKNRRATSKMPMADQFRHLIFVTPVKALFLLILIVSLIGISGVIYADKVEQRNIKHLKAQVYGIATGRLRYNQQEHPWGGRFYYNRISQSLIVTSLPADVCQQLQWSPEAIKPTVCEMRFNPK